MSKSEIFQALDYVVSLALLAVGLVVYTRVTMRLARKGGEVRVAAFQFPELLVAIVLASFFGYEIAAGAIHGGDTAIKLTIDLLILSASLMSILGGGVFAFLVFSRKINCNETFGFARLRPLKITGWAIGLYVCAAPLTNLAAYATQITLSKEHLGQQAVVELFRDLAKHGNYWPIGEFCIATVIAAPACEEFLFRGFFYGVGKRFLGAVPAGILSAFVFAAFHSNLSSLAPLFVLALCFTLAYERTGSLFVPMGMHALFNSINLFSLFGQVKGWFPEP